MLLRSALERPGEFPASYPTDFELLSEADHYHRFGPPFLMRYLPFWVATVAFRIVILVIPLLALLIPLMRITPPLYVWRTRARIYRWYKHLREIDQRIDSGTINATVDEDIAGLLSSKRRYSRFRCRCRMLTSYTISICILNGCCADWSG